MPIFLLPFLGGVVAGAIPTWILSEVKARKKRETIRQGIHDDIKAFLSEEFNHYESVGDTDGMERVLQYLRSIDILVDAEFEVGK